MSAKNVRDARKASESEREQCRFPTDHLTSRNQKRALRKYIVDIKSSLQLMKKFIPLHKNSKISQNSSYRNCNLKLKSSFTKVKRIIPQKITQLVLAVQYRHKKRCTNCQDHEEMKPLLKQKLKEQLQRTRQTERNKESRTLGLEAIGKLCRHGRIIYYSLK